MSSHSEPLRLSPAAALELRFANADAGEITGVASVFDGPADSFGDVIARGAFAASLARHRAEGTRPAMLWQHAIEEPIGVWTDVRETGRRLEVKGRLNLDTARGREARSLIAQGALNGLSIGFKTVKAEPSDSGRRLTEIDLWEVSLVTFPSQKLARVIEAKSIASARDFEKALRSLGFPRAAASKLAARGWSGLATPDETLSDLAREIRATAALFPGE